MATRTGIVEETVPRTWLVVYPSRIRVALPAKFVIGFIVPLCLDGTCHEPRRRGDAYVGQGFDAVRETTWSRSCARVVQSISWGAANSSITWGFS